jgi:hypothetical protein
MNAFWITLACINGIVLFVFFGDRNAVWGGLTMGAILGLLVAAGFAIFGDSGFVWQIMAKWAISFSLVGAIFEFVSRRSSGNSQSAFSAEPSASNSLSPDEIEEYRRKLAFMQSNKDMLLKRSVEYVEEHPDVSFDDAVDIVAQECFLEHEIATLEHEIATLNGKDG